MSETAAWASLFVPEQQTEDGEGADVDAAARDGREDAADEAGSDEDNGFKDSEFDNRVIRFTFFLSEILLFLNNMLGSNNFVGSVI